MSKGIRMLTAFGNKGSGMEVCLRVLYVLVQSSQV